MLIEFDGEPIRLDLFLAKKIDRLSRTKLVQLIKDGQITVDGDSAKPSFLLRGGEQIEFEVPRPEPYELEAEDLGVEIVYEEEDFLIANKPQGMLTHPAGKSITGTLVNAMMFHCAGKLSKMVGVERPGIVHRLDKDTSGLIIVCKNDQSMRAFAKMFNERKMNKHYFAICKGHLSSDRVIINAPIGRDLTARWKMQVQLDGREAISKVTELEKFKSFSFVEIKPVTGRTHQIRVHLTYIGHPILGDSVYGGLDPNFSLNGQLLHCGELEFDYKLEHYHIKVDPPKVFLDALERLRLTKV
jgi:23S rRNA pseudouridine1911/1915/1917 synthase